MVDYYYIIHIIDEGIKNYLGRVLNDFEEEELKKAVKERNLLVLEQNLDLENADLYFCDQCKYYSMFSSDSMNQRCLSCEGF